MSILQLSTSPSRSNPKTLNGLRVAVPAYVFLALEKGVTKVEFLLDGKSVHTETVAPWDFVGTGPDGRAYVYDFTKMTAGKHTIAAKVWKGNVQTSTGANFTVVRPTVTAPVSPVGGGAQVPAPVVTTVPTPPVPVGFGVVSPYMVTTAIEIQDLAYAAART